MKTVVIIDYGMGNLHSVTKAIRHVSGNIHDIHACNVVVTNKPEEIAKADKVIFPGVGAMRDCINELHHLQLGESVINAVKTKPVLSICLGMQALMSHTEENDGIDCLDIIKGNVKRFPADMGLKVPHMGWNIVKQMNDAHPIWHKIPNDSRFYFVHSYYVQPDDVSAVGGETDYGFDFSSVLLKDNLVAAQFHPEKSSKMGLQFLENFLTWSI